MRVINYMGRNDCVDFSYTVATPVLWWLWWYRLDGGECAFGLGIISHMHFPARYDLSKVKWSHGKCMWSWLLWRTFLIKYTYLHYITTWYRHNHCIWHRRVQKISYRVENRDSCNFSSVSIMGWIQRYNFIQGRHLTFINWRRVPPLMERCLLSEMAPLGLNGCKPAKVSTVKQQSLHEYLRHTRLLGCS